MLYHSVNVRVCVCVCVAETDSVPACLLSDIFYSSVP